MRIRTLLTGVVLGAGFAGGLAYLSSSNLESVESEAYNRGKSEGIEIGTLDERARIADVLSREARNLFSWYIMGQENEEPEMGVTSISDLDNLEGAQFNAYSRSVHNSDRIGTVEGIAALELRRQAQKIRTESY